MRQQYKTGFFWCLFFIFLSISLSAQPGGGNFRNRSGGGGFEMPKGRFYGKVVDEAGKGVGFASVQLYGMQFDTISKKRKETLITGQITEDNGDFSLEEIPVRGDFTLKISFLGYADIEQKVTFGIPGGRPGGGNRPQAGGNNRGGGRRPGGGAGGGVNLDKDLGNIVLTVDAETLDAVEVTGEKLGVTLELDKKIFRVDKNATSVGGTAIDALQNVPSLSIDLDGNLTLRNAAPQLFVDGRPTTLSLDQIAADAIESVEVITNPSAKYDASGGQAGIVNIVLKKERRLGYNGNARTGVDSRGGFNIGGDINLREGDFNGFLNANLNRRVSYGRGGNDRQEFSNPQINRFQKSEREFIGTFLNVRGGVDWFANNRNTFTFSGSLTRGGFTPEENLETVIDTLLPTGTSSILTNRFSDETRDFQNLGASILYKYLFPKEGKELTADINYNRVTIERGGDYRNEFVTSNFETLEKQEADGSTNFITFQTDFVDKFANNIKVEAGLRAAIRSFENSNANFVFNPDQNLFVRIPNFADEYEYTDHVYAAYGTFSQQIKTWSYQVGLRIESSQYTGKLLESNQEFENDFPFTVFPSAFVTKQLNDQDNIQLSYSRRINRPSFFQLLPFIDFSDSLDLRRGNPNLLPEFTNSLELTYQNIIASGHNILLSVYYKQANDLITSFQEQEIDPATGANLFITTYTNSNSSQAYGVEFTMRNTFFKNIELTSNINLYNSRVDASNVQEGLINDQFSWFLKENLQVKLPEGFSIQIITEYRSRQAFNPSGGGRFSFRRVTNTAQGYTIPAWFTDIAIKKDIMKRKASITFGISDLFRSRRRGSHSESVAFIQDSWSYRNLQLFRLNFSYRFGKPDFSLFKRKNNRYNSEGSDMMGG